VGLGGIVSSVRNAIQAYNTLSNEERPDNVRAATLLARIRAGDVDALGHLFVEYGEPLYRLAYRVLSSASDAEDVVQDVFAALPTALLQYKECGCAIGWLRRVTVRASLTRRRAGRRADDLTARYSREVAVTYETNQTASRLEPFPLHVALEEALRSLPNTLRLVFLLRETEGYSHREIADALGISEANSKVRLNRAAKKLQYLLRDWL
jgi:RNA polymerase sigma-70 factor (ECF subfamily)